MADPYHSCFCDLRPIIWPIPFVWIGPIHDLFPNFARVPGYAPFSKKMYEY
eukprot:SAG22_NODE_374_length_11548_cov_6.893615_4_plen_51_part_00